MNLLWYKCSCLAYRNDYFDVMFLFFRYFHAKLSAFTYFAIVSPSDKTVPSIHWSIIAFNTATSRSHTADILVRFVCQAKIYFFFWLKLFLEEEIFSFYFFFLMIIPLKKKIMYWVGLSDLLTFLVHLWWDTLGQCFLMKVHIYMKY